MYYLYYSLHCYYLNILNHYQYIINTIIYYYYYYIHIIIIKIYCRSVSVLLCRGKVQSMLDDLCQGVGDADMLAAFHGLLEAEPHVRAAAVAALPKIPLLAEGRLLKCITNTTKP